MKHNRIIKEKVRELRVQGLSLDKIYTQTNIPKTTIRTWIKDIQLSSKQLRALKENTQKALQAGRERKQKLERDLRLKNENSLKEKGIITISKLSRRDFLIAGCALYWAEGFKNKHEHRLGFCNSDPKMIKFYIKWLKDVLKIKETDIIARLTLNESYKNKTKDIESFWSETVKIPLSRFSKTFYQKTKWKKQYDNQNYHGVLRVHVKNSLNLLLLTRGFIEGMKLNVLK